MTYQMDTLSWEAVQVFISRKLPVDTLKVKSYLKFFLPISLWHRIWPSGHHWNPSPHMVSFLAHSPSLVLALSVWHTLAWELFLSLVNIFHMPFRPSQYILDFKYRYIVNVLLKKEIEKISCISRKGSENSRSRSSFSIYNVKMLYHLRRKY